MKYIKLFEDFLIYEELRSSSYNNFSIFLEGEIKTFANNMSGEYINKEDVEEFLVEAISEYYGIDDTPQNKEKINKAFVINTLPIDNPSFYEEVVSRYYILDKDTEKDRRLRTDFQNNVKFIDVVSNIHLDRYRDRIEMLLKDPSGMNEIKEMQKQFNDEIDQIVKSGKTTSNKQFSELAAKQAKIRKKLEEKKVDTKGKRLEVLLNIIDKMDKNETDLMIMRLPKNISVYSYILNLLDEFEKGSNKIPEGESDVWHKMLKDGWKGQVHQEGVDLLIRKLAVHFPEEIKSKEETKDIGFYTGTDAEFSSSESKKYYEIEFTIGTLEKKLQEFLFEDSDESNFEKVKLEDINEFLKKLQNHLEKNIDDVSIDPWSNVLPSKATWHPIDKKKQTDYRYLGGYVNYIRKMSLENDIIDESDEINNLLNEFSIEVPKM